MVLKEVVIPTYTVAISYLVIVIVYLYRYILHPPKSDNGIEDPQETTDCSGKCFYSAPLLKVPKPQVPVGAIPLRNPSEKHYSVCQFGGCN